jgi:hypothetical protein
LLRSAQYVFPFGVPAYGRVMQLRHYQTSALEEPTQDELADTDDPKLDRKSSGRGKGKPASGG